MEIYAPLANRLGIWELKWQLEDLAFRHLEPEKYQEIARQASPAGGWRARSTSQRVIEALRQELAEARSHGRDHRAAEAHLQHLPQDAAARRRRRPDLRPAGGARAGAEHLRVLHRAGRGPRALAADPRPVRRLHRQPQGEPVPVAAHHRDRARRAAARDPDPHPRDAPGGRVRRRGALALQGRRASGPAVRRQGGLAAPADGLAAGRRGRGPGVRRLAQDRHLPGPGLRLHPEGRDQGAAERRDAARLRLSHPHRRRPPVRRRQGQRAAGVAGYAAAERRHRRDHHRQGLDAARAATG